MGQVDPKLMEMAQVFHVPKKAVMKYIILPAKMPGLSKLLTGRKGGGQGAADKKKGGSGQ